MRLQLNKLLSFFLIVFLVCSFLIYLPKVYAAETVFGNTTPGTGGSYALLNDIAGGNFSCPESGTVTKIVAKLSGTYSAGTIAVKCALYQVSNNALVANSVTDQRNFTNEISNAWYNFTYSGTQPTVTAQNYYIVAWCNRSSVILWATSGLNGTGGHDADTYGTFPDPFVPIAQTYHYSIYAVYTAGAAGQNLTFPLYQSLYISGTHYKTMNLAFQSTDSFIVTGINYFWKAVGFKTYDNINLHSDATMNKALQFGLFNFISLIDYSRMNKELGFGLFETVKILDNATASFQIAGAKSYSFIVYGLLQLWGYDISNKHVSFVSEGLMHVWDNSSMSKAVVLRIFQVFSPLILNDYVSASFTIASGFTIDLAVGIGILALVLAIAGISLVVLRRKQTYA